VRVEGLSKQHRHRRGPPGEASGSGASAVCRLAFSWAARASTLRLLSGGEVVVLEEVPGHEVVSIDESKCGGQAATKAST
jgi:hypothetical protein